MKIKNFLLDKIHRALAKSRTIVLIALKIRNQANAVVRMSLQDGIKMDFNGESKLIEAIAPSSKVVIDVGANVGVWIYRFMASAPLDCRGIAFEPVPETALLLRKNMPGGFNDRINIKQMAVGDKSGQLTFFAEDNAGECSSFIHNHTQGGREILVEITTIDNEWIALGCPFVDFLKIDAEGYDLHVLRGARQLIEKQQVGVIQFEYNSPWASAGSTLFEAISILSKAGYSTKLVKKNGLVDYDYKLFGELFSYCNFVSTLPSVEEARLKHLLQ